MNPKQIGIGLAVLAIVAIAVWQFGSTNKATTTQETTQVQVTQAPEQAMEKTESTDSSAMTASTYKDGEYTAEGNYKSPAQEEAVEIAITLADGVVTDAVFTGKATNQVSQKLQGQFAEGFKEEVVGKSIDEINLTVVNGSSLTPKGFMDALEKVKAEAQA